MLRIKKASAGSGKTFTLARQYITLLLGDRDGTTGRMRLYGERHYGFLKPKPHGRILAITFTKKATREMTDRIISELALLAARKRSDHLDYLCELYGASPEQIAQASRRALVDLLFNFSSFNVSTIDSFFQNILRIFTRELDLPEVFNLEISESYPVAVATGEMFSSINLPVDPKNKEQQHRMRVLKRWMRAYMESLLEEGKNANLLARSSKINRELVKTLASLRNEDYKNRREEIQNYLADPERIERFAAGLSSTLAPMRSRLTMVSRQFLDLEEAALLPKTLSNATLSRWAAEDFSYDPMAEKRTTLATALADPDKRHNKPKKGLAWSEEADRLLVDILNRGKQYFATEKFYRILSRQIYILGLFSHAERHIDEYCRENEAFLLGDTNLLLRKVINDAEAPFVYERIGTTINHFLIDEFQDTSEMQWQNLAPLLRESMSRKQDDLIIGDEKQCIYRFRNSKPELLGSMVENEMTGLFGGDAVEVSGGDIEENTNWRSKRNVVIFNNTLFKRLAQLADRDMCGSAAVDTYSALVQKVAPKNLKSGVYPGYVKVMFGPDGEKDAADETAEAPAWTADDQLRHLAGELSRELSAGYRPGEIAVLVRRHFEGERVIEYLLREMENPEWPHGMIPIMSDDALEISSSAAVQLIIGILRLCTTPQYVIDDTKERDEAVKEENRILNPAYLRNRLIHRYDLCLFDRTPLLDEDGEPVLDDAGMPRTRLLSPQEALAKAIRATSPRPGSADLDDLQRRLDTVVMDMAQMDCPSLFAIVERIIHECLPKESLTEDNAFLSSFQDLVLDFEEAGDADIESFLEWWDTKGSRMTLPPPEGMDALRVMTIHQAKGLEMPCVHVPFCDQKIYKLDNLDWYSLDRNGFPGISPEDVPPCIPLTGEASFTQIPMLAADFEAMKQAQMIDCLNVIYVAFTRAENELVVYSNPAKRGDNFGRLLLEALSSIHQLGDVPPAEQPWLLPSEARLRDEAETGGYTFELGEPRMEDSLRTAPKVNAQEKENAEKEGASEVVKTHREVEDADFGVEIDYEALLDGYISNRPGEMIITDDIEQQGVFDPDNERHRGNFLHDVLAHVSTPADLPLAMERAAYRRALPPEYWHPLLQRLNAALKDQRVRPWFEGYQRILTERPLTAADGLRRPDRVVFHPDGSISVVDYKFGHPSEKYRETYRNQVRDYMAILATCGYRNLRGYLFYPLSGVIFPVE